MISSNTGILLARLCDARALLDLKSLTPRPPILSPRPSARIPPWGSPRRLRTLRLFHCFSASRTKSRSRWPPQLAGLRTSPSEEDRLQADRLSEDRLRVRHCRGS